MFFELMLHFFHIFVYDQLIELTVVNSKTANILTTDLDLELLL